MGVCGDDDKPYGCRKNGNFMIGYNDFNL